jgi:hypothetical protein
MPTPHLPSFIPANASPPHAGDQSVMVRQKYQRKRKEKNGERTGAVGVIVTGGRRVVVLSVPVMRSSAHVARFAQIAMTPLETVVHD